MSWSHLHTPYDRGTQISFIDIAARRRYGYKPEELIVTLPHFWFVEVIRNHQAKKKFPPYNPLTDSFTPDNKEVKLEDL